MERTGGIRSSLLQACRAETRAVRAFFLFLCTVIESSPPDIGGLIFGNIADVATLKAFPAPSDDMHDYPSWAR